MSFRCHWMHPGFCRYIVPFCLLGFPVSYFLRFYHTPAASQSSWSDKSFLKLKVMGTFSGSVFCRIFAQVSCDTKIPFGPRNWLTEDFALGQKIWIKRKPSFVNKKKDLGNTTAACTVFFFFLCKCTNLRAHAECKETSADKHTLIGQWHSCVLINRYCLHLLSWFLALSTNVCVCSLF